jgi:hypothetical protein
MVVECRKDSLVLSPLSYAFVKASEILVKNQAHQQGLAGALTEA